MARAWQPLILALGGLAALAAFALLAAAPASAWTSPGGGNTYDMSSIDTAAGGDIDPLVGTCHYRIQQTVTISAGDSLTVDAGCWLEFDQNRNMTVLGQVVVGGNLSAPAQFDVFDPTPVEGEWGGVTFLGASALASTVDNLTMRYSTFGLRCLACQNLSVANLNVTLNSGDGVLVLGNAWNLSLWDISVAITTYTGQSPIGISRASNITGGRVTATGTVTVITLWNVSNVSFWGPSSGTGIRLVAAWLDNASNLSVSGLSGGGYLAGVLLTRSSNVSLLDNSLSTTSAPLVTASQVNRLTIANFTGSAASGSAFLLSNLTNASIDRVTVTGTRFVIALTDSAAVAVSNATAMGTGPAFSANRTSSLWVNDSSFQGGSPAAVNLNASLAVSLRNVGATGSATGFFVNGGSSVWLNDSSAAGNVGPGARFQNTSGSGAARTSLTGNVGGGLSLANASNFSIEACDLSGNTGAGLSASASTLSATASSLSGNGQEGLVLTNGTRLDATALVVESNAREGLWARGGSVNLSGATVRLNGFNGTLAEGASLNLTDGAFERNGRYGVFYSANATGSWSVFSTAWVAHNPAVLSGGVRVTGGTFQLLNATVDLQDGPGTPFLFNVSGSGTLSLDTARLRPAGPSAKYAVQLASGSLLSGTASRLESPGRGSLYAVSGSSCQVDLFGVQVADAFSPFTFAGCSLTFTDVAFTNARADVVALALGSTLDALRLTVDSAAGSGVLANASSVDIRGSSFLSIGGDAVSGQAADLRLTDSLIVGTFNRAIAGLSGQITLSNVTVDGAVHGIEATDAPVTGTLLRIVNTTGAAAAVTGLASVDLRDSVLRAPASVGLFASVTGPIDLENVTADGGTAALEVDQSASLLIINSTMTGGLTGAAFGAVGDFEIRDSAIKGTALGLRVGGAGNGTLTRFSLTGVSGPALLVDGAGSITAVTVDLAGWDGAAALNHVPSVSFEGFTVATSANVSTQALSVANTTLLTLHAGSMSGAGPGVGLLIDNASNVDLDGLDLSGSQWQTGMGFVNGATVALRNTTVHAGLTGLSLTAVTGFAVSNLTLTVLGAGVSLWASGLSQGTFTRLTASGGATGIGLSDSSSVWIANTTLTNLTSAGLSAYSTLSLRVSDLTVDSGALGVSLRGCPSALLERLTVTNTTLAGILANASDSLTLKDATIRPSAGAGLNLSSSAAVSLDAVRVQGGSDALRLSAATGLSATNFTVEGSAVGVAAYSASSANFTGARLLTVTKAGVAASNGSSVDLWNSSIEGGPSPPFRAVNASRGALVRLFDTSADNSTVRSDPAGQAEVWWSLRILVLSGGGPVAQASVTLTDRQDALVASLVTDTAGLTVARYAREFGDANGTRTYDSPYRAAVLAGGFGGATTFDHSQAQTVSVNVLDVQAPFLEDRADERTRRGDPVVFQRSFGDNDNVAIVRMEWSFVNETGAQTTLSGIPVNGFRATYAFSEPGRFEVTVRAFDGQGNAAAVRYNVSVNYPPFFLHLPGVNESVALVGVPFSLSFAASDNDTQDIPLLTYSVDGPGGASMVESDFVWTPDATGRYPFTISVFDGRDYSRGPFNLLVGVLEKPGNHPPRFESAPREDANILDPYAYEIQVADEDPLDQLEVQFVAGPPGMSLDYVSGSLRGTLRWVPDPSMYPRGAEAYNKTFPIVLRVTDFTAFVYQNFTLVLRNPPDKPPVLQALPDILLGPGEELTIDLRQFASDIDDPNVSTMRWSIVLPADTMGATLGFDTQDPFKLIVRAPQTIEGTRSFYVTFKVKDPSGLFDTRSVRVELKGPTAFETAFPWLLLLGIVAAAGGAYALLTRQRAGALIDEAGARPASTPQSGAPAAPASEAPFPVYVEGALLYDRSDNLIATKVVAGSSLDDVFILIPAQMRAKPAEPGALVLASVESHDVAVFQQGDAFLAAVGRFAGEPSPWLLDPMKAALAQVQARADELNLESLEMLSDDPRVADALGALLAVSAGSSPEAVAKYARQTSLRVASVVEHLGGLVRLKVAVDNNSGQIAADVRLSLDFDEKVLRLERIEPAFEQRRDRIHLGNLRPGERKTVAFYFDPQVCTRSVINATAGWEDATGEFHSSSMRTRTAEVICPAFSTPQGANTAMLRRLLQEELAFRDSKYFRMAAAAAPHEVFEACKAAVLAQDLRLVKQFEVERPYHAEAWFYGETQAKGSPMVIWTSVFGQEKVAQFSVASNAQPSITGLLAELGRRLQEAKPGGKGGPALEAMGKAQAAAEVGTRATLMSKSKEGEAKPKDE